MDVDSHSGQLEASSGGMCLATYILNEPQLLESDVEMIHQPFTPQCKGKAKQISSPQTPQLQGASRVTGVIIFL